MILYNPTVSGSLLVTGSLTTTGTITSQTLVVQTITSSIEFNTGSTRNGTLSTNTHEFTGSVLMSGSVGIGINSLTVGQLINKQKSDTVTQYYNGIVNMAQANSSFLSIYYDGSLHTIAASYFTVGDGGAYKPISFQTSDVERMRILTNGDVTLTSSTSQVSALNLNGAGYRIANQTAGGYLAVYSNTGGLYLGGNNGGGNQNYIYIPANTGNVNINSTSDNGYKLYVNGTSAGAGAFQNVSDGRFKKDITPIENSLTKINQLNGISFNWDKDSRPDLNLDDNNHLGLIAQDVEEILPQVVTTGEDEFGTKTIAYSDIVPVLIEAIKELSAKNTSLEEILQRNNIQ